LSALNAAGEPADSATVRRAVDWLLSRQQPDGGWGEDGGSYEDPNHPVKASTPSQTAWALLGLMAAGEVNNPAVARGVDFLTTAPRRDGLWQEEHYTAVGFPRVFYLRYHGYKAYFPLMALARYRNLLNGNSRTPLYGM
jgi:squalene-hopene/tetraprenyl-beta-curcumene cyclase